MNKKILINLSIIGVIAAIGIGGTIAYFNDTETSTGNIFIAGTMDLKVDHVKQTYNDVDCKTCSVVLISDPTNMVVEKFGSPITPYPAVYVGSVTGWIHPAWTAQNDPTLAAAGAEWIWESDPTRDEDLTNNVTYTFRKTFEWWGPIVNTDLYMAIGSDNSVEVWLNGTKIGENTGEYGYKKESMLHIPAASITPYILQGNNILKFIVKNWALAGSTWKTNPAGLIYKFSINGMCGDDYFKTHCTLWGEKDIAPGDQFFMFDDIKPGDRGTNVISMHVYDNDAWGCLLLQDTQDTENNRVDPEIEAGDITNDPNGGELSPFINVFAWTDNNQNGVYEPGSGESQLLSPSTPIIETELIQLSLTGAGPTTYIGMAWCFGTQTVDGSGNISCNGASVTDIAQTDSFAASLTAYAEQQRNNTNFQCSALQPDFVNGGFETGDFTGWNVNLPSLANVVTTYTSDQGKIYSPVEGNYFAVLSTGGGTGVYTVVSQTVNLTTGQKLAGWVAFDAQDYMPYNDDSAVVIISGSPLATPWSQDVSGVGDYGETPWQYWSWTAPADGTYTLELKVANQDDNQVDSYALFDANVIKP